MAATALGALAWGIVGAAPAAASRLWPLKGIAAGSLALLAWAHRRAAPGASLMAAALVCHAAGDLLLERAPLLAGVTAFALGHGILVVLFWRHRLWWDDVTGGPKLRLGLLALAGAMLLALLRGGLHGPLALAVPLYAMALLAMAAMAQVARRGQPFVAVGAFAFVISDALLGLSLFRDFVEVAPAIWPLYVLAQGSIALGWLFARGDQAA